MLVGQWFAAIKGCHGHFSLSTKVDAIALASVSACGVLLDHNTDGSGAVSFVLRSAAALSEAYALYEDEDQQIEQFKECNADVITPLLVRSDTRCLF